MKEPTEMSVRLAIRQDQLPHRHWKLLGSFESSVYSWPLLTTFRESHAGGTWYLVDLINKANILKLSLDSSDIKKEWSAYLNNEDILEGKKDKKESISEYD